MKIRRALKADKEFIFQMINELENFSLNKINFYKVFLKNLNNKEIFYIVAEENKKIVGFISLHIQNLLHHAGKVAEIQELFINPEMRGLGMGEKLVEYVRQIAKKHKCDSFETTSNIMRKRTHKFYEKKAGMDKTHYKFTKEL